MDPVLLVLMLFLAIGSLVALEMRDLLSAVIAVGAVGLGAAIVFLLLGAPDIAITQVVVEVLVVTVLIRATRGEKAAERPRRRRNRPMIALGALSLLAFLAFTLWAFAALPVFGAPRAAASVWYLRHATELTGASNVVTAILLDFRAYDTLGEATVILGAAVGSLAVLRRPARRRLRGVPPSAAPADAAGTPPAGASTRPGRQPVEVTRG